MAAPKTTLVEDKQTILVFVTFVISVRSTTSLT